MSTEERDSQLSALFDGELDAEQAQLVTRRLLKDPALQATWERYALVGAVMRGEPVLGRSGATAGLAARVRAQVAAEAPVLAPQVRVAGLASRQTAWPRLAGGVALAASVAIAVVGALRWQAPVASQPALLAETVPAGEVAAAAASAPPRQQVARADTPPPSYTTPRDTTPGGTRAGALLAEYVVLHTEASAPVTRLSPLLSESMDPAAGAVEMTEAEIGARR